MKIYKSNLAKGASMSAFVIALSLTANVANAQSADMATTEVAAENVSENANSTDDGNEQVILVVGQQHAPVTLAPRGLTVSLDREVFAGINAINVEDLMKYTPNFFVRKRFAGDDNAVVAMRGANTVQSARTIVMVDGFVVSNFLGNSFSFPPKWNVVGPAEVQQFDIVYGPYSARYSGNSMGGVVSVTTLPVTENGGYLNSQYFVMPFNEYGFDQTFTGYSVEGGYGAVSQDHRLRGRVSFRHFENLGQSMTYQLLTAATGTAAATTVTGAFADPRLATPVFGAASPVDVTQDQYRGRISYDINDDWTIDGLFMAWQTAQNLTDPRTFLSDASGNEVGQGRVRFNGNLYNATGLTQSRFDRNEYLAGIKLTGVLGDWAFNANLSRFWIPTWDTFTSADYLSGASNGKGTYQHQNTPGWYTLDSSVRNNIGAHNITLGVSANLYETGQDTYNVATWREGGTPVFSAATAGKTSLLGVFVDDAIDLDAHSTLTWGLRLDYWRAFDGLIGKSVSGARVDNLYPERSDHALSPKLTYQRELADGSIIQLSAGTATRFPTVGELFQGKIDDVTRQIDPNSFDPNLRAEHSVDFAALYRRSLGPVDMTASLFYQDVSDAVFSFQGLNQFGNVVSSYKNVDEVRQYGAELIFEGDDLFVDGLHLSLGASWMDAQTVSNPSNLAAEGVQFPRIPHWRINGQWRYKITDRLNFSGGVRYATRPNSDLFGLVRGDAYGFQSEYFFVDGRVSYALTDRVEVALGIDNINNDQAYVAHPLPQRTYVLDLKVRF